MSDQKNTQGNKKKNELLLTILFLFLISGLSAAFVIYFRIKMKPYQLPADKIENVQGIEEPVKDTPTPISK